jgi:hypothetical protein
LTAVPGLHGITGSLRKIAGEIHAEAYLADLNDLNGSRNCKGGNNLHGVFAVKVLKYPIYSKARQNKT